MPKLHWHVKQQRDVKRIAERAQNIKRLILSLRNFDALTMRDDSDLAKAQESIQTLLDRLESK